MPLKGGVNPNITYNTIFAEWEAATAANLDLYMWETGQYPQWFMARVIAWHKLHILVEAHTQDAINADMKRKAKK